MAKKCLISVFSLYELHVVYRQKLNSRCRNKHCVYLNDKGSFSETCVERKKMQKLLPCKKF